jgi:hypothetical protein
MFSEERVGRPDSHDLQSVMTSPEVTGGWEISNGSSTCTMGFPAIRRSALLDVFVTNSHCTTSDHALDSVYMWMPGADTVGFEIVDPSGASCYWKLFVFTCREADAALFEATMDLDIGAIARTDDGGANCESCSNSLDIDHSSPVIQITAEEDYQVENETLHKIGKTTGWTYGAVEDTCDDYLLSDGWVRKCADRVDYSSDGGDSGAPVFAYIGTEAELRGIHFGSWWLGSWDGLMSDIKQIEKDVGDLIYFDPGHVSVTIDGPDDVGDNLFCTWEAVVETGVPGYTYSWTGLFTGSTLQVDGLTSSSGWLNLQVTDVLGNVGSAAVYVTVSSGGPAPDECSL